MDEYTTSEEYDAAMHSMHFMLDLESNFGRPFVGFLLGQAHREADCRRNGGHLDLKLEGHVGPDSGWEDWDCGHCDAGGCHIYY